MARPVVFRNYKLTPKQCTDGRRKQRRRLSAHRLLSANGAAKPPLCSLAPLGTHPNYTPTNLQPLPRTPSTNSKRKKKIKQAPPPPSPSPNWQTKRGLPFKEIYCTCELLSPPPSFSVDALRACERECERGSHCSSSSLFMGGEGRAEGGKGNPNCHRVKNYHSCNHLFSNI